MSTKSKAIKKLKAFSKECELIYDNNAENTKVTITTKKERWPNGYKGDVDIYYEVGTSKKSFWQDVIDQIETSTCT